MFQIVLQPGATLIALFCRISGTLLNNYLQAEQRVPVLSRRFFQKGRPTLGDRWKMKRGRRRIAARDQMMQCSSQTIDITPGTGLTVPSILLRRRIAGRAKAGGIIGTVRFKYSGRAKINQGNLPVRLQHDIGRFQIPVNDGGVSGMKIMQYLAELNSPGYHIFHGEGKLLPRQALLQRLIQ